MCRLPSWGKPTTSRKRLWTDWPTYGNKNTTRRRSKQHQFRTPTSSIYVWATSISVSPFFCIPPRRIGMIRVSNAICIRFLDLYTSTCQGGTWWNLFGSCIYTGLGINLHHSDFMAKTAKRRCPIDRPSSSKNLETTSNNRGWPNIATTHVSNPRQTWRGEMAEVVWLQYTVEIDPRKFI